MAALLNISPAQIAPGLDEFMFDYTCSPEKLVSYLFDVEKLSGNLKVDAKKHQIEFLTSNIKVSHVANSIGYLMKDVFEDEISNYFRFHKETHEPQLLFENDYCYGVINEYGESETVHICWDPYRLYLLEKEKVTDRIYLLSSGNEINSSFLYKKVKDHKIIIHTDECKPEETLSFLSYYSINSGSGKSLQFIQTRRDMIVNFKEWNPVKLMNILSFVNKKYTEKLKLKYNKEPEGKFVIYDSFFSGSGSYIKFHVNPVYCTCLLEVLLTEMHLENRITLNFYE